MKPARLRSALLATTSAAALSMGAAANQAAAACYTGPFPFTNSGAESCIQVANTTFTGSVVNFGTIMPGGVTVVGSTIISSSTGITDNGFNLEGGITVDSASNITTGITPIGVSAGTFQGGIHNAGTLTSQVTASGIGIGAVATFGGGITNTGSISAGLNGISVFDPVSTAAMSGGIVNTGTITAGLRGLGGSGIIVSLLSLFDGGITNNGGITAVNGIVVGSSGTAVSTFDGGVTNNGSIAVSNIGISVNNTHTFSGGVFNNGTIDAALGIRIANSSVTSSITNGGVISASTGILVTAGGVVGGGIGNSGTIAAGNDGIIVNGAAVGGSVSNAGSITGGHVGILVTNADAAHAGPIGGSIVNSGSITSGSAGISVFHATIGGSVSNAGTITGGIGMNVDFASVGGSVGNSGTIVASAFTGVSVVNGGEVAGDIVNTGAINNTSAGVNIPLYIGQQSVGGSVINAAGATISGGYGIAITGSSAAGHPAIIAGNIVNAGTINASNRSGIALFTVTVGGSVINSGSITAGRNGIRVVNTTGAVGGATVAGGITNSGTIGSTGAGFAGIALIGAALTEGLTNSGSINALGEGILVQGGSITAGRTGLRSAGTTAVQAGAASTVPGGITNSGAISGQTGILVNGGSVIAGGIANSGDITGTIAAIDVTAEGAAMTISQTGGTIAGNILLSALADTVNVLGGAINGNIVGAGSSNTINFDPGDGNTFTYAAPFGFSGIDQVNIVSGTVVLNGANSATNVAVTGSVLEVGNASAPGATLTAAVNINDLGTLSGFGTVAGAVTINSGGALAPGDAPGTITVGSLTLNAGSMLAYQLGTAGVVGGPTNDLTIVNGALTINGDTLFVTNSSGFGAGTYRLINYGGALGGSGQIVVGSLPDGDIGVIQTSIAGQVNLIVSAPPPTDIFFWDGTTTVADGIVHGGNGTWDNVATNWTNSTGTANAAWQGISAVFEGAAGTVNVVDTIAYQSMQFSTDGYVVTASGSGALTPIGVAPIIVDGLLTATIAATITGSGGLDKTGLGTLILTGNDNYSGGTIITAATLQLGNGGATGSIVGNVVDSGILAFDRSDTVTFGGLISGAGAVQQIGPGTVILTGNSSYTGGTAILAGTLQLGNGGTTGSIAGDVADNGILAFDRSDNVTFGGAISGSGALQQIGAGLVVLTADNSYTGGTVINAGASLQIGNGGATGLIVGPVANNGLLIFDRSDSVTFGGVISGPGTLQQIGTGVAILTADQSYTGATIISAGTLALSGAGSIAASSGLTDNGTFSIARVANGGTSITTLSGSGSVVLGNNTLTLTNASGTFAGAIGGSGGFALAGGTEALTGFNSYTGPTNVSGGTLEVDGSIGNSTLTTVNSGGVLLGAGTVGNTQINSGGMFAPGATGAPGTSMTVAGNLAFQSGALYLVQIGPADATFASVTGTATLAGTVAAMFTPGSFTVHQYDILHAGSVSGTFSAFSTINLPPDLLASLTYTGTAVFLNLTAEIGNTLGTEGLNVNQRNVANAINNFFNGGGTLPPGFANLFNLTGSSLANALTQLDGEDATGAEHAAFELTNEFLSLMLDPFVYGRDGSAGGSGALGFAPDQPTSFPPDLALAYAGVLKAPPKPTFDRRWTAWGTGFGGTGTANGDLVIGSNDVTATTYGFAAGADYHASPETVLGFSLAGAGTNWHLAQGLGTGRSDAFQAGVYGTRYFGPAYVGAALAFTNNWFTTNRTALGDVLTANFQGQSFGARLEGGYRYAIAPAAGVTPYGAIQAQSFHTPNYSETDLTGGGFGLSYNAMNATDTRSELGARFDALTTWGAIPVQLRARVAWAHDWVSNPALDAVFQGLPGASFVVNGAAVPANSALSSLGAELHLTPRWTLLGKFDGAFANAARTYAGSGTLRYAW